MEQSLDNPFEMEIPDLIHVEGTPSRNIRNPHTTILVTE